MPTNTSTADLVGDLGLAHLVRIVVVDVDDDDRELAIRSLLRSELVHPTVVGAESMAAGLAALASGDFDIALVDAELGEFSGLQLVREARARGLPTPIIVVTETRERHTGIQVLRDGGADVLQK
ncbi:MAG: response regulator, partial [Myxococcota bacterium]